MSIEWIAKDDQWQCHVDETQGWIALGKIPGEWIAWLVGPSGLHPAGQGFLNQNEAQRWVERELITIYGPQTISSPPPTGQERRRMERRRADRRQPRRRYGSVASRNTRLAMLHQPNRRVDRRRYNDHWLSSVLPNDADRRRDSTQH